MKKLRPWRRLYSRSPPQPGQWKTPLVRVKKTTRQPKMIKIGAFLGGAAHRNGDAPGMRRVPSRNGSRAPKASPELFRGQRHGNRTSNGLEGWREQIPMQEDGRNESYTRR
ncbi:hypothetical protein GCM10009546_63690 [Actinomadura livida]|uniref:Uncharacterized protein n=1 Tax=Actinomadura livida TaxID=79909 RepID=A0ABN1FK98_9ACTN|nr:hypothetical protein GCM10010208_74150 [Actinomadura livida]